MQYIGTGKIIGTGQLRVPDGLFMPLPVHQGITFQAELNPCKAVNRVVNTGMTGNETAP